MNKVHWIRDDDRRAFPRKIITHCGKEGWIESGNEFTDGSYIFDAVSNIGGITCGRCLKSAERISKSPWGCRRRAPSTAGLRGDK